MNTRRSSLPWAAGLAALLALLPAAAAVVAAYPPPRVVAVGDVHGAHDSLVQILRQAQLIDEADRWVGGDSILVQTGDLLDRGDDVHRVLDLLRRLEGEAAAAGGRVVVLLGNHEQMNLLSDFRDVEPATFAAYADGESAARRERAWEAWGEWLAARAAAYGTSAPEPTEKLRSQWLAEHPLGFLEYQEALGPSGSDGSWLRQLPVTFQFGDVLFMHAGLGPSYVELPLAEITQREHAEMAAYDEVRERLVATEVILPFFTLEEVNALVRREAAAPLPGPQFAARRAAVEEAVRRLDSLQELLLADAPLWYRGYSRLDESELQPLRDRLAAVHGVRHVVSAHSPTESATIEMRMRGTFFLIDAGMLTRVYGGRPAALEVAGGRFTAIYPDTRQVLLELAPDAAFAGRAATVFERPHRHPGPRFVVWQADAPPPGQAPAPAQRWMGPDGEPLPFTTEEEVLDFLRTATVLEIESIPEGVTKPQKVLLERDGVRANAAFRYHHEEGRNVKLQDGTTRMFFLDSYRNEVAAYELSRLLDMRNVPPAILREVDGKDGSLQIWIQGGLTQKKKQAESIAMPSALVSSSNRHVADMDVFDNLINNTDRNAGNILWGPDWNLWLIDHTRAFDRSPELIRPEKVTRCSRPLFEALERLDEALLRERLDPYLGTFEIRGVLARRDKLLKKLRQEIERRGEDAVLFIPGEEAPAVAISYDESI